jgi:hypothetical protein
MKHAFTVHFCPSPDKRFTVKGCEFTVIDLDLDVAKYGDRAWEFQIVFADGYADAVITDACVFGDKSPAPLRAQKDQNRHFDSTGTFHNFRCRMCDAVNITVGKVPIYNEMGTEMDD